MTKFIGNKAFYKMLLAIVVPIVLQQFITQFVSLLDNLMVGQVGNSEMTGVSLANQLLFVFNLGVFGSLSGASIFASQYFGAKNKEGYQETMRFKRLIGIVLFTLSTIIFLVLGEKLISSFIYSQEGEYSNPLVVLNSGKSYLYIMILGNIPFLIKEIYASSLREQKETLIPMLSGIVAIFINLIFNYLLIFGKLGFPNLGIKGAAIATVISRFVEMGIVLIYSILKKEKYHYLFGVFNSFIKKESLIRFLPKTLLLFLNEFMFSLGLTLILKCYALKGLDYVSSFNICNTANNLFLTVGTSLGNATAIILGIYLGAGNIKEAQDASYKLLFASITISIIFALLMVLSSFIIPNIYNTSNNIKEVAKKLILIGSILIPINAFNCCCYFTLRAGGRIIITMLFDSASIWILRLPLAFVLSKYTNMSIFIIFTLVNSIEIIKLFIGYHLVNKGIWLKVII